MLPLNVQLGCRKPVSTWGNLGHHAQRKRRCCHASGLVSPNIPRQETQHRSP